MKNLDNSKKKYVSYKLNIELLSHKQLAKYEDSLDVLGLMRRGGSIQDSSKQVGISIPTVKKYIGSALKIKNHRLVARQSDSLLRKLRIYENGKEEHILMRGRKNASVIGQYMGAVGRRVDNNDTSALKPFENKTVIDSKGKHHKLETNIKNLIQILEKREEPEFFTIYQRK